MFLVLTLRLLFALVRKKCSYSCSAVGRPIVFLMFSPFRCFAFSYVSLRSIVLLFNSDTKLFKGSSTSQTVEYNLGHSMERQSYNQ